MPKDRFIYLRFPDGREQRVVNSATGEKVARTYIERDGATRYEPDAPYTAEDAVKARREQQRPARTATAKAEKPAEKPAAEKTGE